MFEQPTISKLPFLFIFINKFSSLHRQPAQCRANLEKLATQMISFSNGKSCFYKSSMEKTILSKDALSFEINKLSAVQKTMLCLEEGSFIFRITIPLTKNIIFF